MSGSAALIIFVKEPVPGKVKTRLAASIGDSAALDVYGRLLAHTDQISDGFKRYIFYAGNPEKIKHFSKANDIWEEQNAGNLGERMSAAFTFVFDQGHQGAIIIGSDCAQLAKEGIERAVDEVNEGRNVLGPALDGGYYLLGLPQHDPTLFVDMPWSTDRVAQITRERMIGQGKTPVELPTLRDVDYLEDLKAIGWSIRSA